MPRSDNEILKEFVANHSNLDSMFLSFFRFLHEKTDLYVLVEEKEKNFKIGFKPKQAENKILQTFRAFPYKELKIKVLELEKHCPILNELPLFEQIHKCQISVEQVPTNDMVKKITIHSYGDLQAILNKFQPFITSKTKSTTVPSDKSESLKKEENVLSKEKKPFNDKVEEATLQQNRELNKQQELPSKEEVQNPNTYQQSKLSDLQVPVGNGGSNGSIYRWTQTLKELTIYLFCPKGTRAKQIEYVLTPYHIHVGIKTTSLQQQVLLEGMFPVNESVEVNESCWSLDEEDCMIIVLVKKRENWWKSVVQGHPEIDATLVDSTRKIDEYSNETQGAIRKIIAQQRE